ncbi:MAG: hypothetical protein Q9199_001189 [Rusavskia elegans]
MRLLKGIKEIARTGKATLTSDLEEKHKYAVRDIPNRLLPRSTLDNLIYPPQGLLRYWGPQSHTEYDEQLGFLSSSWKTCTPAKDFEELNARTFFLGSSCAKALRQHCENDGCPSEWISLAREVSWTLKQVNEKWPMDDAAAENKIALISTARMERLGILCDQSNILIERAGESLFGRSNPHGVKFAWPGHYLVYGWIPVQCIVKTFSLSEFRDICSAHDIRPDGTESIDPYTLLPADSDAFVESIVGNMENLGL